MKRKRSSSPETGSTSHGSSRAEYDVFLSFRGPDTRANFTDSLYHTLWDKGIHVFIDKKGIDVGEEIGPEIFQAIDDSKICIPIFSRGYASSSWCLRELEHMMQRRKTNELEVLPVFYDVEPSDVKLETGVYRDALTRHKRKRGAEIVQRWEEALKEVTGIKGWDTKHTGHGELAHLIARKVSVKLKVSCVHISDHLVGMDESVNEVVDLLNVESKDIRLIGIWGMGGIGKTTLAKAVYDKLSNNFDSCSFISDIREASQGSSLLNVQRRLVSDIIGDEGVGVFSIDQGKNMIKNRFCKKKVIIFLDDVDHESQLMALAAKKEWFGLGSRIVVTTRDRSVFCKFQDQFEHCLIYEVKELNNVTTLQLFSKHAFRSNSPPNAFLSLSEKVIAKTGGLPLAVEVIGSFLCGKTKEAVWQDTLKKMEHSPRKDVKEKLMLSYEVLDAQQRQIFLDIACFLSGHNKSYPYYMWDDCGFFPNEGIDVLLLMSLVKIKEGNSLWMHDQLKDLGRSIVYQENCEDPRKGSRVWKQAGLDIVNNKQGTETVAVFCREGWPLEDFVLTPEDFIKVPNIRFLTISGRTLSGDLEGLFSELRWLCWQQCPKEMQATNFCPKNLVILDLSHSSIDEYWGGWTQLKVATRLKVLDLSWCHKLSTTPDLSAYLSLEILNLEKCESLLRIDRSIVHLRHLKHLRLGGCFKLQALPDDLGSLKALTELRIEKYGFYGSISRVPSSIGELVNLERLVIVGATKLMMLPDSIGMLKRLAELDISETGITELPITIVNLESLKVLKMNYSRMQKLPEAIGMLEKLEEIYGKDCTLLEMIPSDIARLPVLKILKLTDTLVKNVPKLPQSLLPSSLREFGVYDCRSLEVVDLSDLSNFKKLMVFRGCPKLGEIQGLDKLESLESLHIRGCSLLRLPDLSNWKKLKTWDVDALTIDSARGKQVARSYDLRPGI
ncbi:hypothetical protein NL676_035168 [Syzygium grande]|nr:hypothetical protein NL676_035168 [Syzygium grande]